MSFLSMSEVATRTVRNSTVLSQIYTCLKEGIAAALSCYLELSVVNALPFCEQHILYLFNDPKTLCILCYFQCTHIYTPTAAITIVYKVASTGLHTFLHTHTHTHIHAHNNFKIQQLCFISQNGRAPLCRLPFPMSCKVTLFEIFIG